MRDMIGRVHAAAEGDWLAKRAYAILYLGPQIVCLGAVPWIGPQASPWVILLLSAEIIAIAVLMMRAVCRALEAQALADEIATRMNAMLADDAIDAAFAEGMKQQCP